MSPFIRSADASGQRGSIMLTFAFSCIALLVLAGLAVDSANLFFTKLAAQSAADAGALSGLGVLAGQTFEDKQSVGGAPSAAELRGENAAFLTTRSNLIANGVNVTERGGIIADVTGPNIAVEVFIDVPLYILSGVPGMNVGPRRVRAVGRAALRSLNVSLVLDTSSSMACPEAGGEVLACPCVTPTTECEQGPNSGAKIQSLITAARNFVDYFEPDRDSMNLVAFSHGAELKVPFERGSSTFQREIIRTEIGNLRAQGATNMFDGLLTSRVDAINARKEDVFTVIFTDGAPTATRFTFDRAQIQSAYRSRNSVRNTVFNTAGNWHRYDWINWGLTQGAEGRTFPSWVYVTPPAVPTTFNRYWDKYEFTRPTVPSPPSLLLGAGTPFTSVLDPDRPHESLRANGLITDPIVMFPPNIKRRLGRRNLWRPLPAPGPGNENPSIHPDADNFTWGGWDPQREHLWMYTDMAIMMTDHLRDNGGTVFVIGYGPSADFPGVPAGIFNATDLNRYICPAGDILCVDPYQDVRETHERKDIINNRLALSVCGWNHPNFFGRDVPALRDQVVDGEGKTLGEYYQTDDAQELQDAFDKIAREIKMRRVSSGLVN